MTYPGPSGEPDERPLDGPDLGMGLPESGTQHATSTDDALPADRFGSVPRSRPPYDEPADPLTPTSAAPAGDYGRHAYPDQTAGGVLDKVKAFADKRPELFLGAALLAGWLLGRVFSSSDDSDD